MDGLFYYSLLLQYIVDLFHRIDWMPILLVMFLAGLSMIKFPRRRQ